MNHKNTPNRNADLLDKFAVEPPLYAGFWKRVLACILDAIPFFIIQFYLDYIFQDDNVSFIIGVLLNMVYFVAFHASRFQATPGKILLEIKVVGYDGGRISYLRSFCRFWATYLSFLLVCIGVIMAGITNRKQALHDIICSTYVINKDA